MSHLFWLEHEHLKRFQHLFPKPRSVARSDDRKVLSGIIHNIRNGLRRRDAPPDWGRPRALGTSETAFANEVREETSNVIASVREMTDLSLLCKKSEALEKIKQNLVHHGAELAPPSESTQHYAIGADFSDMQILLGERQDIMIGGGRVRKLTNAEVARAFPVFYVGSIRMFRRLQYLEIPGSRATG